MKKMLGKIITTLVIFGLATTNALAKEFKDLTPEHHAYEEIMILAKDDVVIGYPDETFRPDQPVSKAEFVTMVIKALWQENYEHEQIYYYEDVPQDYWAYEMIQIASEFDLLKGYPDGYFKPDENLKREEAVKIVTSAVNAEDMEKPFLSMYINPEELITRGEMAVMLYKMREQALLYPNKKLVKVFTPRKAEGIKLENVVMEPNGFIAIIPAGTVIQGTLMDKKINSQEAPLNRLCVVKTQDNYVTKDNYLLFPRGTNIAGEIVDLKKAMYFIRNAEMDMDAKRMVLEDGYSSELDASMYWNKERSNWFMRLVRVILKGKKVILRQGDTIFVELTEPVKVDTAKTMIIN